jgi:hypothetical protein
MYDDVVLGNVKKDSTTTTPTVTDQAKNRVSQANQAMQRARRHAQDAQRYAQAGNVIQTRMAYEAAEREAAQALYAYQQIQKSALCGSSYSNEAFHYYQEAMWYANQAKALLGQAQTVADSNKKPEQNASPNAGVGVPSTPDSYSPPYNCPVQKPTIPQKVLDYIAGITAAMFNDLIGNVFIRGLISAIVGAEVAKLDFGYTSAYDYYLGKVHGHYLSLAVTAGLTAGALTIIFELVMAGGILAFAPTGGTGSVAISVSGTVVATVVVAAETALVTDILESTASDNNKLQKAQEQQNNSGGSSGSRSGVGKPQKDPDKANFRRNLQSLTGEEGVNQEAHHVFPQEYRDVFDERFGLNIDEPKYGSWVEGTIHRKWSWAYNQKWFRFLFSEGEKTLEQVLQFGRQLASEYNFALHY